MSNEEGVLKCKIDYDPQVPTSTFHQFIIENLTKHPGDGIAVVDYLTHFQWTFKDILKATLSLSASIQSVFGLGKGQVVALALPNCSEFFISFLAISRCGGVSTLVNPSYTILELENVVKISRPIFWICSPEVLIHLDKITTEKPHQAIVVNAVQSSSKTTLNLDLEIYPWTSAISSNRWEKEFTEPSFDVQQDLVALPFSSGTTGMPKGVMLTHQNLVTAICSFIKGSKMMDKNDIILGVLPFYHIYGCVIAACSLTVGARIVNFQKFSFTGMLQSIQNHKISLLPIVPPIATMLSKNKVVDNYDLSSVQCFMSGAAPLSSEVVQKLINKFGWQFLEVYGMTECCVTHIIPRGLNELLGKIGSIGILLPFMESKILDVETLTLSVVGSGKVGELCLRGPTVMKGYKGNPTDTAKTIDSGGWLHTGDLAYYDENGWFFIVGRLKELLKCKGYQVAPSELEHIILQHSEVVDAAVIGIPDEFEGELPKAFVVKRAGSSVTEEDVANFLNNRVSSYKHLRGGVVFISEIPKSSSGKILRKLLVNM